MWLGKLVRESTKQGSDKIARQMEAAHRTSLAKGEVGLRDKKISPTLKEFIENRFEPWAKATFEKASPKTWFDWYRVGLRAIKRYRPLADSRLNEITSETLTDFAAHRQTERLQVSTINSSLRIARRVLRLAVEWGAAESSPKVKLLPGERHRERVVTPQEEAKYLSAAPEPVASISAVLCDTGLRPEECFRLRWEAITWVNGRHGSLLVTHGKTAAARRVLPMTPRVRGILETRWEAADKPLEGWIWTAPTRSGHVESSSLKKRHTKAFKTLQEDAAKNIGLRRMDAGANRRTQQCVHVFSLRSPLRRCGTHCDVKARWAQNWAQRQSDGFGPTSEEAANSIKTKEKFGGRDRARTGDPLLAKQVLSQLSYTPILDNSIISQHLRGNCNF